MRQSKRAETAQAKAALGDLGSHKEKILGAI